MSHLRGVDEGLQAGCRLCLQPADIVARAVHGPAPEIDVESQLLLLGRALRPLRPKKSNLVFHVENEKTSSNRSNETGS